jgi:hypothetical protein
MVLVLLSAASQLLCFKPLHNVQISGGYKPAAGFAGYKPLFNKT